MNKKRCAACKKVKTSSAFNKRDHRCRACRRKYYNEHRAEIAAYQLKHYRTNPKRALARSLAFHLKKIPSRNPITVEELLLELEKNKGCCALSGIKMERAIGKGMPQAISISIDRIKPHLDYSKGNVRLICHGINAFKGRMSDKELLAMTETLVKHLRKKLR